MISRDEVFGLIKSQYVKICQKNLKIYGIKGSKTLIDFVTTDSEAKKGSNRLPLNLARLYEEDILKEDKGAIEEQMAGLNLGGVLGDDFAKAVKTKHQMEDNRRKSMLLLPPGDDDFNKNRTRSVSIF